MTPSNRDAVQFTRESAERIASVVRAAELAPTTGRPLSFDAITQSAAKSNVLRVGTFTGAWDKDASKTVTFYGDTKTVTAQNMLFDVLPSVAGDNAARVCIIGKEGTAWHFINVEREQCNQSGMRAAELSPETVDLGSSATQIAPGDGPQVLVNSNGCVTWVKLSRKEVTLSLGFGDSITFETKWVWVFDDTTPGVPHEISLTECEEPE